MVRVLVLCLALVLAALNLSWFYRERLWSRLVSAAFWLLLITFAVSRQPWQMPALGLLFAANVALRIHERRSGKTARATAKIMERVQGASLALPPAPAADFLPTSTALEARLSLPEPHPLQSADGVTIELPAGEQVWQVRLELADEDDDEPFGKRLRCTAASQAPGAGETLVFTRDLAQLVNLEACASDGSRKLIPWAAAPEGVQETFARRCLIADCATGDDSRVRFPLRLGHQDFVVMTKYLTWTSDLALDPDGRRLWVRVTALSAEQWSQNPFVETSGGEYLGEEAVPAFCFEMPVERLLPDDEDEE